MVSTTLAPTSKMQTPSVSEEVSTPPTSNCASAKFSPTPFTLGKANGNLPVSYYRVSFNPAYGGEAKFSEPTDAPILLQRRPLPRGPTTMEVQGLSSSTPVSLETCTTTTTESPEARRRRRGTKSSTRELSLPEPFRFLPTLSVAEATLPPVVGEFNNTLAAPWMVSMQMLPFWMLCDFLRTYLPWILARDGIYHFWYWRKRILRQGVRVVTLPRDMALQLLGLFRMSEEAAPVMTLVNQSSSVSLYKTRSKAWNREQLLTGEPQGIPNLGETCFLNSVLQSLASLEPFLVYLDRLYQVQLDLETMGGHDPVALASPQKPGAARLLLDVLSKANGTDPDTGKPKHNMWIDPRPLLQRVGENTAQFGDASRGEQQDAQELLQALLGVIIKEAPLTSTSDHMRFSQALDSESTRRRSDAIIYMEDERLTAAVVGKEKEGGLVVSTDVSSLESGDGDSVLSLASLLERMHEGQQHVQATLPTALPPKSATGSGSENDQQDLEDTDLSLPPPEEKKQEDFEDDDFAANAFSGLMGISNAQEEPSMSMKIVQSTISSITPSPLSGWLGSTLQCCKCKHVRPIQNSPFLDIPLVPTSIPSFLERAQRGYKNDSRPPNLSSLPSCRLEQCLADFTSVEYVQDVECQNCTIQAEIMDLEEEEMLLQGAISSTEKKFRAKGQDPHDACKALRDDLSRVQIRLMKLRTLDPDEGDAIPLLNDDEDSVVADSFVMDTSRSSSRAALKRGEARKCLFLTRCPSVLCCHIQRNYYDPFQNRSEKCIQYVQFPEYLDLSPYCAYSASPTVSWAAGKSTSSGNDTVGSGRKMLYRLHSVIEHKGNANAGHYLSYRRLGSSWYRISDKNVAKIPWEQVRLCQAYMLFYEAV